MLGGSSFQLGRIFGIRIGVNASWFLILFLFIFWLSISSPTSWVTRRRATRPRVAAAVLFFGSIVLHELGHALAARRSGIEVTGIDLFFFGGVMKMSRDTDTPGKEFFVAVAGPARDARDRAGRARGRESRSPARTTSTRRRGSAATRRRTPRCCSSPSS